MSKNDVCLNKDEKRWFSIQIVSKMVKHFDMNEMGLINFCCNLRDVGREPWSSGYGETHVPKVVGSNPGTKYWMDIFHTYLLQKL